VSRLFGTDGIRGVANGDLQPSLAFALGKATARRLAGPGRALVVGQDTRRSGDMFVAAIAAGATSLGADVHLAGVLPTPALAYIAGADDFAGAIMVSASHNPAADNGLKVLDERGMKLDDTVEDELETLIWRADELVGVSAEAIGRIHDRAAELRDRYIRHRSAMAARIRTDLHVVLDCANGAASEVAPEIIAATGARVVTIHAAPDGSNINLACGATAPASLAAEVVARGADIGFALDGDADRCVAIDATGSVVDGDQLIGMLALERMGRDALPDGLVVVTVLSNGGLGAAIEAAGGSLIRTPVGDKYILEGMLVSGAGLGGEKSGHVIVREHSSSGDGILTALEVLRTVAEARRPLADLAGRIPMFPQEQRAVRVRHKEQWEGDPRIRRAIATAEKRLGPGGRVLVRPSGTEPALRVMIEGSDAALVAELADTIAVLAEERLH
jgi:phosphoglucosamine mutase